MKCNVRHENVITKSVVVSTPTHRAGIVSLQEANMAFLPYESKVFTLDYPDVFEDFYSRDRVSAGHVSDRIADQLATVCSMMGEYPSVRYRT